MSFASSTFSQAPFASQGTVSPTVTLTGVSCRSIARIGAVSVLSEGTVLVASFGIPTKIGSASGANDSSVTATAVVTKPNINTSVTVANDSLVVATATSTKTRIGTVEGQVTEVILQGLSTKPNVGTVTPKNSSSVVATAVSTKGAISTNTTVANDSSLTLTAVSSKTNIGTVEPQITEIISESVSTKTNVGNVSLSADSTFTLTATSTKANISTNTTAVGVIFDFEAVRDTFSQKRTVYVERQTTSLDRTVNVSAFPRVAFAQRQTTTGDRTIFVPFEDRRVYVERQTTSAERTVRVAA